MNIDFSAEELTFQQEVSAFLAAELPSDIRDKAASSIELTKDDFVTWQKILAKKLKKGLDILSTVWYK